MDFKAFLKDIEKLDQINADLKRLEDPEYIAKRTEEVFSDFDGEKAVTEIMASVAAMLA